MSPTSILQAYFTAIAPCLPVYPFRTVISALKIQFDHELQSQPAGFRMVSYLLLVASRCNILLHVLGRAHVVNGDPHRRSHGPHVSGVHHYVMTIQILTRVQVWRDGGVTANAALGRAVSPLAVDTCNVMDAIPALVLANGVEPDEVLLSMRCDLGWRSRDDEVAGDGPPVAFAELRQAEQE